MPRPTRFFGLLLPGAGASSSTRMSALLAALGGVLDHLDEVRDPGDHAADLRTVRQHVAVADAAEAEGAQRAVRLRLVADGGPDLGDGEGLLALVGVRLATRHQCDSPAATCFLRS